MKALCRRNRMSLGALLAQAGVSRTAYFSLARKDNILPKSLRSIAHALGAPASAFLLEEAEVVRGAVRLAERAEAIARRHRIADRDNVRHTLILLQKKPIERLERGLLRAQALHTYR